MSIMSRAYWLSMVLIGSSLSAFVLVHWRADQENLPKFALYSLAAILTSRLKISLPGVFGTLSMNYLFVFLGILELRLGSGLIIGLCGILAQTLIRPKQKPRWHQVLFNLASISLPISCAYGVLRLPALRSLDPTSILPLLCASMTYFLLNTSAVSVILGLTTRNSPVNVWRESFFWTSPQYLAGGAIAGALHFVNHFVPWQGLLLSAPPIYLVYLSYRQYLGRVDEQQKHIGDMARLHWRTIEALALAIEAKDDMTAAHLKRVQVYATEVAKDLNLSPMEMKAIEAAALLHDIGKLAVPEYIISKPGKLTAEEFERMKIHPAVGAEILERVDFPYPVVPIVRSHHEKYDGTGYPDGLKGEEIPIGARVIAAVDCLDALASERQYRPAMPLDEAMAVVQSESGKSFDPRIVAILQTKYRELEAIAKAELGTNTSKPQRVATGNETAPATGFAAPTDAVHQPASSNFTAAIANARREVQMLVEMTNDLGFSLSLDETMALLALRLGACVPHDTIVIYIVQGNHLKPQFVKGESFRLFSSLEIPIGQGLSGWVAENNQSIVNGNPSVEPGYLNDPQLTTALRSGISVPLLSDGEVAGVLSLYSVRPEAFSQDHLRILLAIRSRAGTAIANSMRMTKLKSAADTDELTGLLNAGALCRALADGISIAQATGTALSVIMLDLDGFKQANDRFGHLTGNRILERIATELTLAVRSSDYVARLGGDEFVVVLKDVGSHVLNNLLDRINEIGPRVSMEVCHEPLVQMSVGVAAYPEDGSDVDSLLETADQKMYAAKRKRKLEAASRIHEVKNCA
ncbi:sensor domain-containing diguanylate cyclase/phosphohydrolase [Nevskia soli]|uniref:sensor domain-containing diguanylate cyclase/phosphohydrolase n=1 Tax=Nevskia soli TaxID=418856 RepID=UPI0015D68B1E|nr:HD domain-containing phosphohydrolase [Nevskia soli]